MKTTPTNNELADKPIVYRLKHYHGFAAFNTTFELKGRGIRVDNFEDGVYRYSVTQKAFEKLEKQINLVPGFGGVDGKGDLDMAGNK